jgi:serine/threonine protein kinase
MDCSKAAKYSGQDMGNSTDWSMQKTKVDVWALGIVLYAMITGGLPFTDDFLPRLQQTICRGDYPPLDEDTDEDLADLIERLLTVDRDSRPLVKQVLAHPWLKK